MIPKVQSSFKKIEQQRSQLLQEISLLSEKQQLFKPKEDSWNVLQVCMHLIIAEENSLAYMKRKIKGIDRIKSAGFWAKLRLGLLNSLVKTRIKFKAPKVVELDQNMKIEDFDTVQKRWDKIRTDLYNFADKLDHERSEKMIFKHPIAGMFNVRQLFDFIKTHVQHHVYQVDRIKNHPDFPKN